MIAFSKWLKNLIFLEEERVNKVKKRERIAEKERFSKSRPVRRGEKSLESMPSNRKQAQGGSQPRSKYTLEERGRPVV